MSGKANIVKLGAARKRASSPETAEELARLASSIVAFENGTSAAQITVTSLSDLTSPPGAKRSGLSLKRQEPEDAQAETVQFRKKPTT